MRLLDSRKIRSRLLFPFGIIGFSKPVFISTMEGSRIGVVRLLRDEIRVETTTRSNHITTIGFSARSMHSPSVVSQTPMTLLQRTDTAPLIDCIRMYSDRTRPWR